MSEGPPIAYESWVKAVDQKNALTEALLLVSQDMHNTSTRPCSTCSEVTKVLGAPFGCIAYRGSHHA